jgi:SMI1 / KNR4 family (SUKH-1)
MAPVRDVIERLSEAGQLPSLDQLVGVPIAELDAWEREHGITLPIDYRSFMEAAGATIESRLLWGSGFFWPAPVGLREVARISLEPEEYALIPDDALFILEHQGYIFVWLDTRDPAAPVYVSQPVDVGAREIKRIADSFREWLLVDLSD